MALDTALYLQFFIGLIAILNPFGLLPVFIGLTSHQSQIERAQTNATAMITVFLTLIIVLLVGQALLKMFGISIASFRIAGGGMLILIALSMLKGQMSDVRRNEDEVNESVTRESIAVVPLAIPLIAGPGAMTTAIVYSAEYPKWQHLVGFGCGIAAAALICWLVFRAAPLLSNFLGHTGINIITRIMGLIMMAMAVEFMSQGLKDIFPVLQS
ncbi:YchE family NAAT transporter [Echinimonas agarilytica]|nr:YchE family NAAT transporter [Echinimonas agarilytica]